MIEGTETLTRPATIAEQVFGWLARLRNEEWGEEEFAPRIREVLGVWYGVFQELKAGQTEGLHHGWHGDAAYGESRSLAAALLELMGYLSNESLSGPLRAASRLHDPYICLCAVLSLVRRKQTVEPEPVERAAASDETRILLWEELIQLHMLWMMPERWAQPEQLAASDLSRWVALSTGSATPPEVQLAATRPVEMDGSLQDVFLFRFREGAMPWLAGIAGPYTKWERVESPRSAFEEWESMSPDEHLDKLLTRR